MVKVFMEKTEELNFSLFFIEKSLSFLRRKALLIYTGMA